MGCLTIRATLVKVISMFFAFTTDQDMSLVALKFLGPTTNPPVPWHRVIGASGAISSRGPGTDGARRQRDALIAEGVEVTVGRTGEMRVDFSRWGWFPEIEQADNAATENGNSDSDPDEGGAL